jgi:autotransporter-associated beta strand protein
LTKTGSGTLTLSGSSANSYSGLTTISAGTLNLNKSSGNAIVGATTISSGATLLLSASNQVDSGAGDTVTLSGGTIERASGVTEVFGNLNVTQASFINFSGGTGNSITFTGLNYTPSAILSLQLLNFTQGNTLVFQNTTDMSSLIGSGFTFGGSGGFGSTSFSGSTFTITAIPEPSTYLAAAGLLALFLWPARRRLLKDAKSILGLRANGRDRIESYRNV